MKISLRTRSFLIEHDEKLNQENWNEKGFVDRNDAIQIIKEFRWEEEVKSLKNSVNENRHLTIDQILEPGFNLYNQEDETELYIGSFGEGNFDLSLISVAEDRNLDVSGLAFQQIIAIVELFYRQEYDEIKRCSQLNQQRASKLKLLLEDRDSRQTAKKWRALMIRWILRVGIVVVLYLILKLI